MFYRREKYVEAYKAAKTIYHCPFSSTGSYAMYVQDHVLHFFN